MLHDQTQVARYPKNGDTQVVLVTEERSNSKISDPVYAHTHFACSKVALDKGMMTGRSTTSITVFGRTGVGRGPSSIWKHFDTGLPLPDKFGLCTPQSKEPHRGIAG
jgi:hypothetical protein